MAIGKKTSTASAFRSGIQQETAQVKDIFRSEDNSKSRTSIYIDKSLMKQFKIRATQEDTNVSELMSRLMRNYLDHS
ncbi:hypothetical protein GSS88_10365 [Corynebacterium sp. 3HC-13]|uniref:hypothetical protein n=1 Tax=Corynebacterium poyangense TaxID=2684405 RepID=UPI001CCB0CD6|nr:hypothetical protein [Corynebacterium poyangense]MBZ8178186.1 hypothetical protein [Corynebacterium poyangense]